MKKTIAIIIVALMGTLVYADTQVSIELVDAIGMVESGFDPKAIGDNGKAVGILQIHKAYVDDVNRILGRNVYTYEDRWDAGKSYSMAFVYLNHYGRRYKRITGNDPTMEVFARIHNGGPNGWKKYATKEYGDRCVRVYDVIRTKSQK